MSGPDDLPEAAPPLRLYAVQPRDTFRWIVVATGIAPDGLNEALAAPAFAYEEFRPLGERGDLPTPAGLQFYADDEARPLMPDGWHYDDLTRCWRAPGEGIAFCGRRWVRIMCDVCADGVWDAEGASSGADDLPIALTLVARFRAWQDWYDRDYDEEDGPFDRAAFAAEGLAIARAVKAELPDWTVVYLDEEMLHRHSYDVHLRKLPRSVFEHEITLLEAAG